MVKASDYPRALYAGYFEFIESKGQTVARVYGPGGVVEFAGTPADAEKFVIASMAQLKKGA